MTFRLAGLVEEGACVPCFMKLSETPSLKSVNCKKCQVKYTEYI